MSLPFPSSICPSTLPKLSHQRHEQLLLSLAARLFSVQVSTLSGCCSRDEHGQTMQAELKEFIWFRRKKSRNSTQPRSECGICDPMEPRSPVQILCDPWTYRPCANFPLRPLCSLAWLQYPGERTGPSYKALVRITECI